MNLVLKPSSIIEKTVVRWLCQLSIVLIACQSVNAQTDIAITLPAGVAKLPISEYLALLTQQTGFDFAYNAQEIDADKAISLPAGAHSLAEALDWLADKHRLKYRWVAGQIVLQKQPEIYTISGHVSDSLTLERLIGATISLQGNNIGAVTNEFGFYSLSLPEGNYELVYGYVGYKNVSQPVELTRNQRIDLLLPYLPIELPDIIVAESNAIRQSSSLSTPHMQTEDINRIPEFAGSVGLVQGLQTLPGIKGHGDGSAFFYTRGGDKDQNLIIIDDAPIFNPAHLFGFYSIVIPDFTKEIRVYKGEIPAQLGDRISSIVSIRTKDGNLNKWQFSGALNPLVNRFSLEFPTIRKKGSIFTSLRRSNFEWIYRNSNPDAELAFGDFSFKWNQKLHAKDRIYFTLITAADQLSDQNDINGGINWGNAATTIRWNHIFSPKLFSNMTLYAGSYAYRLLLRGDAWETAIGTAGFKWDFQHYLRPGFSSRFGIELAAYGFNPGRIASGNLLSLVPEIKDRRTRKRVVYFEADWTLHNTWQIKAGIRIPSWDNLGPEDYFVFDQSELVDSIAATEGPYQSYFNVDPRISIRYNFSSNAYLKLSVGRYHQFLQLIRNSNSPFTSLEVWLPSGPNIRPQRGDHLELSFGRRFSEGRSSFSLATYYKRLSHQIDYTPHARTLLNPLIEGELRFGQVEAYGVEASLEKKVGHLTGSLNYTWSRAMRTTPDINGGLTYPAFQDRPHDLAIMLHYQMTPRLLMSAFYSAYSGSPFTSPTSFFEFNQQTVPIYNHKHNDRLPAYRRLDLALKYRLNKKADNRYQHHLHFSLYNALNTRNVVAVNFNKIEESDGDLAVPTNFIQERDLVSSQFSLIPVFPSLTYKFSWR